MTDRQCVMYTPVLEINHSYLNAKDIIFITNKIKDTYNY